jgi:outer membrane receptor protein involved in Fe transport
MILQTLRAYARQPPAVLLLVTALLAAFAQAAERPPKDADQPADELSEVVVTGTFFKTPNAASPTPVAVIDSAELQHQGASRAEDLLNSLPQTNSGLTLGANGAGVAPLTGTATVDLRGIGAFRTLVLMNGRRLNPGDPTNPSADLNTVPSALVKRVEVLTGGASSTYGSDAISGVVNFIMDTGFTGTRVEMQGHINYANNDDTGLQNIARASGIQPANGSIWDGSTVTLSMIHGADLFGGAAHLTGYFEYNRTHAVLAGSRDFSACTLQETDTSFACLLDGTTPAGQFVPNAGSGTPLTLDAATGHSFRTFDPAKDSFNPAPYQSLQRPDTRYNAGLFGEYKLSSTLTAYLEAQFSDDRTSVGFEPAGTTPTGSALNLYNLNCNNPFLSASQLNDLCTQFALGTGDTTQIGLGRRAIESGPLTNEFHHRSLRFVAGVRGNLSTDWTYDASLLYGNTDARVTLANDISATKLQNALTVVNVNGVPTCQSVVDGTDPNCVPYNVFSIGGLTSQAARYIAQNATQDGYARHWIITGSLTGELGDYGLKSPFATEGIEVATGAEYRTESINNSPDAAYTSGDLVVSGSLRPTRGTYHVYEVFGEVRLPLLEAQPFAKLLQADFSDRYARYTPQGPVNALKFGLEWAPLSLVRLRGSFSRAVRAPNGHELFLAQTLTQTQLLDPCAGPTPSASQAACAQTGVSASQYGNIPAATAINQLIGGNPDLKPETANTVTAGFVLTPQEWLGHLVLSADYWRIRVRHFLGSIPASITLDSCLATGDPTFCSLIHRDTGGSLSLGNGPTSGRIIATGLNTGSYGASGVDIDAHDIFNFGAQSVAVSFEATRAIDNPILVIPGQTAFDCTGYFGPTCTGAGPTSPVPTWRHKLRLTWTLASGFEASVNWRHIARLASEHTSSNPQLNGTVYSVDDHIPSFDYLDADVAVPLRNHLEIRLGINNLTGRRPPIVGYAADPLLINGNLAAGMYDFLGRDLFLGVTANF